MIRTISLENGKYEFDIDDYGLMTAARRHGVDWSAGFELRHTKVFFAALDAAHAAGKAVSEEREANAALIRREADALVAESGTGSAHTVATAVRNAVYEWAGWIERGEHRK